MKEPLNKGTDEEFIPRIRWSELETYVPFRFKILDWKGLKIAHYGRGDFMLVLSELNYNGKKVELCVPYDVFVRRLKELPLEEAQLIVKGKAVIEIVKTFRFDNYGMRITKVNRS